MMSDMPKGDSPKSFNVRVLSDGKYVLSCGMDDEYAYDTIDELLTGLKSDLEEASVGGEEETETSTKKKEVKKMMEEPDEE